MLFSRKTIITHGRKPLYAASKVLNASSASASSVFAKCWVHSTNKTSALLRTVRNRAYSTRMGNEGSPGTGGDLHSKTAASATSIPFYRKLINAWTQTPTKWYPLPIAVGALLLVAIQYRKKSKRANQEVHVDGNGMEIIRLKGPWQVHVIGALPLRNMSRLWGYINSLELPIWFRPYGLGLYALIFGCNLDEIDPPNLKDYPSLGAFFYRKLKPGSRPVDSSSPKNTAAAMLVSPADGTVLHFGTVNDWRVEQVKGMTYSLDALLGVERPGGSTSASSATMHEEHSRYRDMSIVDDREFANVNGIEYSLEQLLGGGAGGSGTTTPSIEEVPPLLSSSSTSRTSSPESSSPPTPLPQAQQPGPTKFGARIDASIKPEESIQETLVHDASVALEMGVKPSVENINKGASYRSLKPDNALFFSVIYLAPGDYHRFHSPTAWVVEKRRHFVGELYSVSPYMAKRLENLFVLNERVALLGRWKHGFFSMVPVGATNVGSIKINFDKALRTNVRGPPPPPGTYTEAVYSAASPILNGQPLIAAQEMGGFCLGSTIVLVFEAPKNFEFAVKAGERVRVGQRIGDVGPVPVSLPGEKVKED